MPECSKCETRIRSGSLCEVCAVERNHAGVDHDRDDEPRCGICGDVAPDGAYADDAPGVWLCSGCQSLGLTPSQHQQLVAETPAALGGLVRWAIGDDSAYPDCDPAELEVGFETASRRVAADGGQQICTHCGDPIDRDPDDPPLKFEDEPIHWDCLDDAQEEADDEEWDVEQQGLDGEPAKGQTTVDGGIAKDGGGS